MAIAAEYTSQRVPGPSPVRAHELGQGDLPAENLRHQPWLMDQVFWEIARHHGCGSLGLEH
ncbi:MAG: hypothetical protein ACRDZX_00640 [Acidimicrobiales bacterium]